MKNWKPIATAVVLVLILIVILQNTSEVETKILFVTITMPRALLLGLTLIIGVIIGLVWGSRTRKKAAK